jgi:hypothetical protein
VPTRRRIQAADSDSGKINLRIEVLLSTRSIDFFVDTAKHKGLESPLRGIAEGCSFSTSTHTDQIDPDRFLLLARV